MVIVCGIPIYFLEYSVSKFSGRGPFEVWDISPLFRGVGVTICAAYGIYMIGASIFRCWIIEFLVYSFTNPLPWSTCVNQWNSANCQSNIALTRRDDSAFVNTTMVYKVDNSSALCEDTLIDRNLTKGQECNQTVSNTTGSPMSAVEEFCQYKVLQLSNGIGDLTPIIWWYFLYMALYRLLIFLGSVKSMKSIEKIMYVTTTFPVIITAAIFIRSLMLPGAVNGIHYFFYPDFGKILEARVWIEATLMAFYTLSFGWGANLLLGSHAQFKENCLRTSILIPIIDMSVAIFSGLACFSVLGNMAHSYNVHVTEVINAGMATGMVAYITALTTLPLPQVWCAIFLISLLFIGVDSQLIPVNMIMELTEDLFPSGGTCQRICRLATLSIIMFLLSLVTCTGAGGYMFLWMDWYGGAWFGPIVALIEVVVVAWIYGMDRFDNDINMMIGRPVPAILRIALAFISPIIVAVIFFTSISEYTPPKYGSYTYPVGARMCGWILVGLIMMPIIVNILLTVWRSRSSGSYLKKIGHQLRPLVSWGPCESKYTAAFLEQKIYYSKRTFKDLLCYNLFGSYPTSSIMSERMNLHKEMRPITAGLKS